MKYLITERFKAAIILPILFIAVRSIAQEKEYPIIGQPVPDFRIENIKYYDKSSVSSDALRGQYVILDFWSKSCASCIASFPKANELQEKFGDKVKIFLVGYSDKEQHIQPLYERVKERYRLNMTVAFDSMLLKRFVPQGVPHLIWINREGIVQAITTSVDLNEENISKFTKDESFSFLDQSAAEILRNREVYDKNRPFLINGNGGASDTSYSYRSVFAKWTEGMGNYQQVLYDDYQYLDSSMFSFTQLRTPLSELYYYAYLGRFSIKDYKGFDMYAEPIFELKDSSMFENEIGGLGNGMWCYSLEMPGYKVSKEKIMRCMQYDLENFFGYHARVEEREMPCYILVANEDAKNKLPTKGDKSDLGNWSVKIGGRLTNQPMHFLLTSLRLALPVVVEVYDETGIDDHIDLDIQGLFVDVDSAKKTLNKIGLDLIPAMRKMKVFVISDSTDV